MTEVEHNISWTSNSSMADQAIYSNLPIKCEEYSGEEVESNQFNLLNGAPIVMYPNDATVSELAGLLQIVN